jgi:hypothetical protein
MITRDEAQTHLRAILDLLGPGAWFHVDDRWLWSLFAEGGASAAERYAKANHCCFIEDGQGGGKFGRAYFKRQAA